MQFDFDEEEFTSTPAPITNDSDDDADEVELNLNPAAKDDELKDLDVIGLKLAGGAKHGDADEIEEQSPPQSPTTNGRSTRTLFSHSYSHATEHSRPNPQVMAYSYMTGISWEKQRKTQKAIEAVRKKSKEELVDANHSEPSIVKM